MKLQTEIPLHPQDNQLDYSSKVLLLGSCFSENIGEKFEYFKFQNVQNPFGVIFNPISVENLIFRALEERTFSEKDIFEHNGNWKCFEVSSKLVSSDRLEYLGNLNAALHNLRDPILNSTHTIFTFGTSWVYRHAEDNTIVSNCHKIPQKNFAKELLSIDIISKSIRNVIGRISEVNPNAACIITVSPVRHLKDGVVENSLSKAHLISAIQQLLLKDPLKNLSYFPSYEIMMDELRDYRFYSEDMVHPNKTAIEILWEKFSKVWISPKTELLQKEIATIQSGLLHRPFNLGSAEHRQFSKTLQQKISSVKEQLPHVHF